MSEQRQERGAPALRWPESVPPRWGAILLTTLPRFVAAQLRDGGERPAIVFEDGVEIGRGELLEHSSGSRPGSSSGCGRATASRSRSATAPSSSSRCSRSPRCAPSRSPR